jgi:putative FmdB family regulatory protein
MPTFDYHCETCNRAFTEQLPMGTKTLPPCPECEGTDVRKVIRPPMVVFKGTGFYKTDSSAKQAEAAALKTDAPAKPDKPAEPAPTVQTDVPASKPTPAPPSAKST